MSKNREIKEWKTSWGWRRFQNNQIHPRKTITENFNRWLNLAVTADEFKQMFMRDGALCWPDVKQSLTSVCLSQGQSSGEAIISARATYITIATVSFLLLLISALSFLLWRRRRGFGLNGKLGLTNVIALEDLQDPERNCELLSSIRRSRREPQLPSSGSDQDVTDGVFLMVYLPSPYEQTLTRIARATSTSSSKDLELPPSPGLETGSRGEDEGMRLRDEAVIVEELKDWMEAECRRGGGAERIIYPHPAQFGGATKPLWGSVDWDPEHMITLQTSHRMISCESPFKSLMPLRITMDQTSDTRKTPCTTLLPPAPPCSPLHHPAAPCCPRTTLHHPAAPCSALHHPAAPCTTLLPPAAPCTTLQPPAACTV